MNNIVKICQKFPSDEWSGVAYYTIEDKNVPVKDMKMTLVDFYPATVDTAASTEFEYDGKHVMYMMDRNPESQWELGHIHSHNKMGVFFSGTDMDDLRKSSPFFHILLSVVVNNESQVCAKVAQTVAQKTVKVLKNFDGTTAEVITESPGLITWDVDVVLEKDTIFDEALALLNKKVVTVPNYTNYTGTGHNYGTTIPGTGNGTKPLFSPPTKTSGNQGKLFDYPSGKVQAPSLEQFVLESLLMDFQSPTLRDGLRDYSFDEMHTELDDIYEEYREEFKAKKESDESIKEKIIKVIESNKPYTTSDSYPDVCLLLKRLKQVKTNQNFLYE